MSELGRLARTAPGPYSLEVRTLANPAAGADFSIVVPGGQVWRLWAVRATLAASAAAGTRDPKLTIDDQTTTAIGYPAGVTTAANGTTTYQWINAYPTLSATAEGALAAVPIVDLPLQPGWRVRAVTGAIDVADQWSAISFTLERLDKPAGIVPMVGTEYDQQVRAAYEAALQGGN